MTACLDEEAVLSFCRGTMPAEARASAFGHISECDECRALVSAVAQSSIVKSDDPATAATTPSPRLDAPPRSSANAPVDVGDLLAGKYSVERVLGSGGMGVVVAARHTQLDQLFALKFLLPAACEAPGAIDRFLREGKAAARITSEHVARVVDTGMLDGGAPYLVMEYLEGTDLAAFTAKRGPLEPAAAVDYVLQACEAIVEAHTLGIVHRDLKPANLFLSQRKDGSALVKVLDFGISKLEGGSRTNLTTTSVLMGSPRYMSPEQMLSAKDVDQRTDIWALGVVLFELVTGKPVWQADTVQGLCAQIASVPAPRLRELVPNAPAVLDDVVAGCLAKSADERIPTIADLALALAAVAPDSSQMSIDRILGVAKRSRPIVTEKAAGPAPATARPALPWALGVAAVVALGIVVALRSTPKIAATPTTEVSAPLPSASAAALAPIPATASATTIAQAPEAKGAPPPRPAASQAPNVRAARPRPVVLQAPAPTTSPAEPPAAPKPPPPDGTARALSDRK